MKKISKLIMTWAISYIILLIIPVFFSNVYGYHSIRSLKSENVQNRQLMISNVQDAINRRISEFNHIARNLQVNNMVLSISYNTDDSFTNLQYTYVNSLQKTCSGFIAANNLLSEIYLYFPKQETIISSKSIFTEDLIGHMNQKIITRDLLLMIKDSTADNNTLSAYAAPSGDLLIAEPLYYDEFNDQKSFCILMINQAELSDQLKDILQFGDSYILINEKTTGISHKDDPAQDILYIPTSVKNLQLAYIEDIKDYDKAMKEIYLVFFATSFLSVALGILFTYYQVKKNYRPLKNILLQIGHNTDTPGFGPEGEYGYILKNITNNQEKLKRQNYFIREEYISRLILGEYQYDKLDQAVIKELELDMLNSEGIVVIAQCPGQEKDSSLSRFTVRNILSELFMSKNIDFESAETSSSVLIMLSVRKLSEDQNNFPLSSNSSDSKTSSSKNNFSNKKIILSDLQFLYEYMWTNFGIAIRIGVGSIYESIVDINSSYSAALEIIEIMKLNNTYGICEYGNFKAHSIYDSIAVLDLEKLINIISSGDKEGVIDFFDNLRKQSLDHMIQENEANAVFFFCYRVCDFLAKDLIKKSPMPELLDLVKREYDWKEQSVPDALNILEDICNKCTSFYGDKAIYKNPLVLEVNQYIDSNFIDSNMNINSIAEKFNFTPAYLSQKYKEATGQSIIDYLYKVRIDQSKKIMNDTTISINEIATMVGFLDSNAFIRIFKKIEGITPGKYRKGVNVL